MEVSVLMITYNHESYIKEAIESVLTQECDFEVELIIADDCSNDKTEEVVKDILRTHPKRSWIKYHKHTENKGMQPNFMFAKKQAKGKYIALCEGDDYWTDHLKLQKQVGFLEANPEYGICFHNVELYNNNQNLFEKDNITRNVLDTTTVLDLARGNFIHTPSVVLRNDFIIPKWFKNTPMGDWTLYLISIGDKKIKKIDDIMAVYRKHNNSMWSSKSQEKRDELTKMSIKLVYNNLKYLNINAKTILGNRIGYRENDSNKVLKKILNFIRKS